ncbi:MAG: hypothetical protein CVT88_01220 [Candidatus Altiarchaeales archaeon HGW-Altiarchaeales-1]|nr:MAG: hypothetical protein CVT88_01220 [Candidatus Altiarchaeales archaeon HGW-Altiarchaeales-1]
MKNDDTIQLALENFENRIQRNKKSVIKSAGVKKFEETRKEKNQRSVDIPGELKHISVEGEKFYFSLSFDIGDYDGGLWWIQIYDNNRNLIFDKPFASSNYEINERLTRKECRKIITYEILYPKGLIM